MKTMLFNPYTGTPRYPDDIKSDPQGLLIVEDGQALNSACPDHSDGRHVFDEMGLCYGKTCKAKQQEARKPGQMAATVEEAARDMLHVSQGVPDGWQLVPKEPTQAMAKAAADAWLDCGSKLVLNKALSSVRAMLASAPPAPQAEKCPTCNDNGLIGGPSFADPGEGGVPCPECSPASLVQQQPMGVTGAVVNGHAYADRLENHYQFECEGGSLRMCTDWVEFRRCFEWLAMHAAVESIKD